MLHHNQIWSKDVVCLMCVFLHPAEQANLKCCSTLFHKWIAKIPVCVEMFLGKTVTGPREDIQEAIDYFKSVNNVYPSSYDIQLRVIKIKMEQFSRALEMRKGQSMFGFY